MSYSVDEFAALIVLSGKGVVDKLEERFSQEDRDLLLSWVESAYGEVGVGRFLEQGMITLEKKLKELKGN